MHVEWAMLKKMECAFLWVHNPYSSPSDHLNSSTKFPSFTDLFNVVNLTKCLSKANVSVLRAMLEQMREPAKLLSSAESTKSCSKDNVSARPATIELKLVSA